MLTASLSSKVAVCLTAFSLTSRSQNSDLHFVQGAAEEQPYGGAAEEQSWGVGAHGAGCGGLVMRSRHQCLVTMTSVDTPPPPLQEEIAPEKQVDLPRTRISPWERFEPVTSHREAKRVTIRLEALGSLRF
ncbi:hypothetical protein E3N88_35247 [Mikania micrantha]|uniref:Uncharacterized protein n=1 Tax=Mikania micrantha TaxID=192012 RepID=A0A5N6M0G0_9ASTR|nr:hypothetical protein E3N88_35247 [Mikania micrantha]